MKRILALGVVTLALVALPTQAGAQAPASKLEEEFRDPPARFAPSCNWWWFGGAYSADDIRESLDAMKAAGLGGFRIFPIYPLAADDPAKGIHNAPYLSPEFLKLVQQAVQYGTGIGLTADTLLNDGWPFGGPYIPPQLGAGQLKFYSREVAGDRSFSGRIPGEVKAPEKLLAVEAAEVSAQGGVRLESLVDLTARVRDGQLSDWQVPAGRWLLMTFVSGYTGMKVKRASVGGEGLVLDHFSREALELHLKHNGDFQKPYLAGVKTIFMDSWEVYGSNWTPSMPEEFEKRRGYSILPYLPALFLPTGDVGARVRYNFRWTLSELALENFFAPLNAWAHANGFLTRIQAHGTPADILEAYGVNDYPEGESYGEQDRWQINIRDRKLASSAAHLFGRNQVSGEAFTWLRCPQFQVTLENMKAAADAMYLDGINQLYYHGVPLTPSWVGAPGWYYYAATDVSRWNTWWPYLKSLSDYIRRADFMLQQGTPVARVAVYLPIEDVWSKAQGSWDDLAGALEKHLSEGGETSTAAMLAGLQDGGFDFDFINAHRLLAARVDSQGLHAGPMNYRIVILPKLESIEPEALERLRDFGRAGGTVIAIHRLPDRSPGLVEAAARDEHVKDLARKIFGENPETNRTPWRGELRARGHSCGAGEGIFLPPDPYQSLLPRAFPLPRVVPKIVPPDLIVEPHDHNIGFVRRETADRKIWFIANLSARRKQFRARFPLSDWTPYLFDAMSGSVEPLRRIHQEGDSLLADLTLGPWDSVFVVFRPVPPPGGVLDSNTQRILDVASDGKTVEAETDQNGVLYARTQAGVVKAEVSGIPAPLVLDGPWKLHANGVEQQLESLVSWTRIPGLHNFSGTGSYRTEFVLPTSFVSERSRIILELGEVDNIAEVRVNGKSVGVAWKQPYEVDITAVAHAGANTLEIRVTNLLVNRMRVKQPSAPDRPPAMSPQMLRDYLPEPATSGLLGPVRVRVVRRVTSR